MIEKIMKDEMSDQEIVEKVEEFLESDSGKNIIEHVIQDEVDLEIQRVEELFEKISKVNLDEVKSKHKSIVEDIED